jgi:hypothetical protein
MKEYNNLVKVNKPIRMMGLTSMQFILVIAILGLSAVIMISIGAAFLTMVFVLVIEIIPIMIYVSKSIKESKKGNYTFYSSWSAFQSTPRKIQDNGVFKMLKMDK